MQQEVVEAEGHLIDSHIMEQIFDTVVEYQRPLRSGAVPHRPHQWRTVLSAPAAWKRRTRPIDGAAAQRSCSGLGCSPVDTGDAELRTVERDRCAPEDFYSTTNHRTLVRHGQPVDRSREPAHGRADRGRRRDARPAAGCAICARATAWSSACAASAWFPNRRSATVWRSRS